MLVAKSRDKIQNKIKNKRKDKGENKIKDKVKNKRKNKRKNKGKNKGKNKRKWRGKVTARSRGIQGIVVFRERRSMTSPEIYGTQNIALRSGDRRM